MSIDTIGNFLTIIRNGLMVGRRSVSVQHSHMKEALTKILLDEGYIKDYKINSDGIKKIITLFLKYTNNESVIHEIKRVSTPGRRCYERTNKLTPVIGGLGISIVTTSHGVMTDKNARRMNLGGEVICHIW